MLIWEDSLGAVGDQIEMRDDNVRRRLVKKREIGRIEDLGRLVNHFNSAQRDLLGDEPSGNACRLPGLAHDHCQFDFR